MKLVIDWSVICHQNWHKMFSANYQATNDEVAEWTRNLAHDVIFLSTLYDPSEIIFALDAPANWRADYTANWYHENIDWYMDNADSRHWFATVDNKMYEITFDDIGNQWRIKKPKTKEVQVLELDDATQYTCYVNGYTPEHILEAYPQSPKHVTLLKAWDGMKLAIPYYKGTRSSAVWKAKTPKPLFKKLVPELGAKLARMVGARAIMSPHAEGDDVIATVVKNWSVVAPDEDITLVTVDADLEQLFVIAPRLSIYNPVKRELVAHDAGLANFHLVAKIIGGDTSDNITGICLKKRKAPMPCVSYDAETGGVKGGKGTATWLQSKTDEAKAEGLSGNTLWGYVYKALDAEAVPNTLERNLTLVFLNNIPEVITTDIHDQIANLQIEESQLDWEDFNMTTSLVKEARNNAILAKESLGL